jgi:hypothetical protein
VQGLAPALSAVSDGALLIGVSVGGSLLVTRYFDLGLEAAFAYPLLGGPRNSFAGDPPLGEIDLGDGWIASLAIAVRVGRFGAAQ